MVRHFYTPLEHMSLPVGSTLSLADPTNRTVLRRDSPALDAMTDLRRHHPVSVRPEETLEQARVNMIVSGVKLLFVRGLSGELLGLITATDLAGERAVQKAAATHVPMGDLCVSDVMVSAAELDLLDMAAVAKAETGHIIATLQQHGRQHALVVSSDGGDGVKVVGLFSSTQIARQMGIPVLDPVKAHTFAQLEAALVSG